MVELLREGLWLPFLRLGSLLLCELHGVALLLPHLLHHGGPHRGHASELRAEPPACEAGARRVEPSGESSGCVPAPLGPLRRLECPSHGGVDRVVWHHLRRR